MKQLENGVFVALRNKHKDVPPGAIGCVVDSSKDPLIIQFPEQKLAVFASFVRRLSIQPGLLKKGVVCVLLTETDGEPAGTMVAIGKRVGEDEVEVTTNPNEPLILTPEEWDSWVIPWRRLRKAGLFEALRFFTR